MLFAITLAELRGTGGHINQRASPSDQSNHCRKAVLAISRILHENTPGLIVPVQNRCVLERSRTVRSRYWFPDSIDDRGALLILQAFLTSTINTSYLVVFKDVKLDADADAVADECFIRGNVEVNSQHCPLSTNQKG